MTNLARQLNYVRMVVEADILVCIMCRNLRVAIAIVDLAIVIFDLAIVIFDLAIATFVHWVRA